MSSESSSTKNPLQREGTSQRARMPESLDPLFAKLDDRDLYDYLDFVYKYSEIVRFHSSEGLEKGDDDSKLNWQIFFSCGIILLSHISRNSSTESNRIFRADLRKLDDLNAKAESLKIEQSLLAYFDKLTLWKSKFSHNDPFKEVIGKIIDDSYFDSLKDSLSKNREKFLDSDYGLEELTQNYLYINSEIIRYFDGLVIEAEKELQLRLANDKFTPHIGLLLSFLELFEKSRNKLNEMTGRHLRFYYEDILQTERKAYVEDEANILVELAKNHDEHLLTQGTLFKGGKDSEGNERLYELTEDFIANTNYVSAVKSSFVDGDIVRAAENSMTLDGIEEALPEEDPVWAPFNNTEYPTARLGFAISSPLLRLETGIKSITLSFFFDSLSDLSEITATDFEVFYSSKSKWVNAELADAKPDESAFVFTLNIPATADPVCDYSALNMEDSENFDTNWPVFKFVLKEEAHSKRKYLLDKNISHWTLSTTVSDIRDSIIQNDLGKLKVEKPFMPFGPQPVKGSQFYIGHPEIFSKKLDSLTLNWDWLDAPTNLEDYYSKYSDNKPEFKVDASVLKDKSWTDPSTKNISADKALLSSLSLSIKDDTSFSDAETLKDFSADLEKGFLRLKLSAPNMAFGHKEYPKIQQNAVIQASSTNDDTRKLGMDILENLNLPYTPTWENLRISYDSSLDSTEDSDLMKLFSLEEFGHVPEPKFLVSEYNEKARLFIGLKNVDEGSSVSLLIQFADGTADPFSADSPSYKWKYLSTDGWKEFKQEEIVKDSTVQLLQSGIVRFAVNTYSIQNSRMPDGYLWIKLEVNNDPALFNKFISIKTQATSVKFQNNSNTLEHLNSSLASGTISKLQIKDPAIKSITQPFESFGGQAEEDEESYTVRISERLRHKDRAIQIWDYERLVLEHFSEIYKVKCLNHTGRLCVAEGETTVSYSEISPGDVTVIAIPDMTNSERYNLARPAVKFATLKNIESFLKSRCSEWVNLEVRNPKYEELNVSLKVKFYDHISNPGFYTNQLKTDIDAFLTPWAYDMGQLSLGNRIYKSTILNFIEERDYVDYLIDFDVKLKVEGEEKTFEEEIIPTSSLSLIVPGTEHNINYITE